MKVEIALIIHGFIMCSNGIYLGELFGNGQDKDPIKDKVKLSSISSSTEDLTFLFKIEKDVVHYLHSNQKLSSKDIFKKYLSQVDYNM